MVEKKLTFGWENWGKKDHLLIEDSRWLYIK